MLCQNCGQTNTQTSNFCRFCGTKMTAVQYSNGNNYNNLQSQPQLNYEETPPRPYSWKTDEYQVQNDNSLKTKPISRVQPLANFQPPQQPQQTTNIQPFQQPAMSQNFHCPRCNSQLYPRTTRQISTAGWIVFAVLLIAFFPLFWIGLLIKDEVRVCPVCNFRYNF